MATVLYAPLPTETYRVTDPIENLQLCVTLRKRATEGERRLKGASAGAGSGADPRAGGYADAEESNARFYNHPHPASTRGPAFEEASELETAWMDPRAAPFRLGVAQPAGSAPGQARHTMQMVWPSDLMLL